VKPPIDVTFKGLDRSVGLEEWVRSWAAKLERIHDRILSLEVTIEVPHHRHRTGNLFEVKIRLVIPGAELVVSHEPGDNGGHEDPYVAVRDAFRAVRRQLEDHVRTTRGDVKAHA
jgi:ribosome-associated translation inhibitor RaiA